MFSLRYLRYLRYLRFRLSLNSPLSLQGAKSFIDQVTILICSACINDSIESDLLVEVSMSI